MNTATFPTYDTVDLFAGPGGWSVAAQRLGLREIGLEFDKAAHLTRRAAGFHTIRDDVRNWGPANFPNARGLIASPPCQTFSAAGKGAGRRALDVVLQNVTTMHHEHQQGTSTLHDEPWEDERTGLVLEPLRWALEAIRLERPYEWLAFEQVPTVLPVWQAMAEVLRAEGYSVAVGNLQAEQYGVPQTRKRAVLVARQNHIWEDGPEVELPIPTHSRYHTRDKTRLDPGVLPWVSMAQALGWGLTGRPSATVAATSESGGPRALDGGSGARRIYTDARESGEWQIPWSEVEPGDVVVTGTMGTPKTHHADGTRAGGDHTYDPTQRPAYTMTGLSQGIVSWTAERPATTIVGSFRPEVVAAPGYRTSVSRQNAEGSVRVSVEEAACLQSFPAGFPWQGSRTKQYQQIGNAIPPLLAEAVLASALGRTLPEMTP